MELNVPLIPYVPPQVKVGPMGNEPISHLVCASHFMMVKSPPLPSHPLPSDGSVRASEPLRIGGPFELPGWGWFYETSSQKPQGEARQPQTHPEPLCL